MLENIISSRQEDADLQIWGMILGMYNVYNGLGEYKGTHSFVNAQYLVDKYEDWTMVQVS
jgi:hypothetical protein